jgi:hypothetical protein
MLPLLTSFAEETAKFLKVENSRSLCCGTDHLLRSTQEAKKFAYQASHELAKAAVILSPDENLKEMVQSAEQKIIEAYSHADAAIHQMTR